MAAKRLREDQYFFEQDLAKLLEKSRKEQEAMASAEKKRLKELHFMHCPKCGQKLFVEKYDKVEVDVCGSCKGLWLDANELEHILATKKKFGPWLKFLRIIGA